MAISKSHRGGSKANEQTFELTCIRVNFKPHGAAGVGAEDLVTVLRKSVVCFLIGTVNGVETTFLCPICFRIRDFYSVLVIEVVLNRLWSEGGREARGANSTGPKSIPSRRS